VGGEGVEHHVLATLRERRDHLLARIDTADRRVAGSEPLPADEQVGHDAKVVYREAAPGAAESRHHLVGDEQHAVAPADLGEPGPVAVGRHERAAGRADDRLGHDGRHRLRALATDHLLDRVRAGERAAAASPAQRTAQRVAGGRLRRVEQQRLEAGPALAMVADAERRERGAVIGELAADDLETLRPPPPRRDVVARCAAPRPSRRSRRS
jgi:hypothetical protein